MSDAASITKIIDYLKTSFIHTDNIEVDYSVSKQIVMEATASLAIEANYGKKDFISRLVSGQPISTAGGKDKYNLVPVMQYVYRGPYRNPDGTSVSKDAMCEVIYCFHLFYVDTKTFPYEWNIYLADDVQHYPPSSINQCLTTRYYYDVINPEIGIKGNGGKSDETPLDYRDYLNIGTAKWDILNSFARRYGSKYKLYRSISNIDSHEEVLSLFSLGDDPYVDMRKNIDQYRFDYIEKSKRQDKYFIELKNENNDEIEEDVLNGYLLHFTTLGMTRSEIGFCVDKVYRTDKYQAVFPFKDRFGKVMMAAVKWYDQNMPYKVFVPVTSWVVVNSKENMKTLAATTCVPCPEKQPLFNLDLIATGTAKTVIITDSLDIASLNQKNSSLPGLVFTSFLCHEENYYQVDWSPLSDENNKIERLLLLVTNHSGYSLEKAYAKAKRLSDYLTTKVVGKREGLDIEFVQMEVRYDWAKYDQHFVEWIRHLEDTYEPNTMKSSLLDVRSVMHLKKNEFDAMHKRSTNNPQRFWEEDDTEDDSSPSSENKQKNKKSGPIPYLMRPLIVRGEPTMLYGPPKCGKSYLAISIAMAIVNSGSERPTRMFKEQVWRVNKPTNNYKFNKVLYLNLELANQEFERRIHYFSDSFWGDKKQQCNENMIIKNLKEKYTGVDFSNPDNHKIIKELLEDAKEQGVKNQPVDLLVIDTYHAFINHQEKNSTTKDFNNLRDKLLNANPELSILIVHHSGIGEKPQGSQSKVYGVPMIFRIEKIKDSPGPTAEDDSKEEMDYTPRRYIYQMTNSDEELEEFIGCISEKREWVVVDPKYTETRMIQRICRKYKTNFLKSAQATMLGVSENTLTKQLKAKSDGKASSADAEPKP